MIPAPWAAAANFITCGLQIGLGIIIHPLWFLSAFGFALLGMINPYAIYYGNDTTEEVPAEQPKMVPKPQEVLYTTPEDDRLAAMQ